MASSTTVPPSATTPATSPQDFILQYMKDTQVDPVHDEISRAPNAYTIFKKYYNLSFTAATVDAWNNLGAYERGLFIDAEEAAKALHKEMYSGYEFKPKPREGRRRRDRMPRRRP
ncbi:hypothetical protein CPB85DRAFT_1436635 [Mucidula mucida]|nr:hypothetical protein CPB85DRAFT_1436635 [Mucidula mucida]